MPARLKTLVKVQLLHFRPVYITFWAVYLAVYLLLIGSVASRYADMPPGGDAMFIGGIAGIFFFLIYAGLTAVKKALHFSPGGNVTRKEYYGAAAFFLVLLAAVTALLQTVLYRLLEVPALALWPHRPIYYFSFRGMDAFNLIEAYWIHFLTALAVVTVAFGIACLHYRFGKIVTWIAAAVFLLILIQKSLDWWIELFMLDNITSLALFSARLGGAAALFLLVGWLALRRAPLRHPGEQ
jgi:hypothetical protein